MVTENEISSTPPADGGSAALDAGINQQREALPISAIQVLRRDGSLNIFNGMVALTSSCDGSHYMPYAEFLGHDMPFWEGR
ncbi:MAG: hypothetical protein HZB57_08155 [Gammaproteobacteria bacterium]|nr:hypothetical protein [Gammaproteobacteria bacterium]